MTKKELDEWITLSREYLSKQDVFKISLLRSFISSTGSHELLIPCVEDFFTQPDVISKGCGNYLRCLLAFQTELFKFKQIDSANAVRVSVLMLLKLLSKFDRSQIVSEDYESYLQCL